MNFEKIDGNKVKVNFEVSCEEFKAGLDYAFTEAQKKASVPGFRKGHVPRNVFEQKYGVEALYEDAVNFCISQKYDELFDNQEFEIVGKPNVDLDWASLSKETGFKFVVSAPIKPDVTLGDYKGLEATKESAEVTKEEVDKEVKELLKEQLVTTVKETGTLENGDTAVLDYKGLKDGVAFDGGTAENATLEIGSHTFIPGFEEQMVGMAPGEERSLNLMFPENYGQKDLAGAAVVFEVKLHEIKMTTLPEITDELVSGLNREDCKTAEEFYPAIQKDLETKKANYVQNKLEDELITLAVNNAKFTPSKEMIETEKNNLIDRVEKQYKQYGFDLATFLMYTGQTKESFEAQQEAEAKKKISTHLVLEAIVKAENITASAEDVEAKYADYAKAYNMPVEELKKYINANDVEFEVSFKKAIDLIVSSAKIK